LEVVLTPQGAFREKIELKKSFADMALLVPRQVDDFFFKI